MKRLFAGVCGILLCLSSCGQTGEVEQINDSLNIQIIPIHYSNYSSVFDVYRKTYPEVELNVEILPDERIDETQKRLAAAIMADDGPDLLFLGGFSLENLEKQIHMGAFYPLNEFMEKEDFHKEEYHQAVLDAGTVDGNQYVMPISYLPSVILSSEEALAEVNYDYEKAKTLDGMMSELDRISREYPQRQPNFGLAVWERYPDYSAQPLYDYEQGKVLLDTPEIKQLSEYFRSLYLYDLDLDLYMEQSSNMQGDGGVQVLDGISWTGWVTSTGDVIVGAAIIRSQQTPVILPIPTLDGEYNAQSRMTLGVLAGSHNRENAWNMIECALSQEAQRKLPYEMPVRLDSMDLTMEKLAEEYGKGTLEGYALNPVGKEFLDSWHSICENVGNVYFGNNLTSSFTEEYLLPYFQGKKSYEECMQEFIAAAEIILSE
ncbi:MAG: ABC transporter substrate-binding protein [Massiliimalia sp.]|jgi:ABC-type glycerol-3-phosphate transport system substrate-binding protein